MSHFYGTLQGSRGEATRCGTKDSGIVTYAAGWNGAIRVVVWEEENVDRYTVSLTSWQGSGGSSLHLATGILSAQRTDPNRQLLYLIQPLEEFHTRMAVTFRNETL